MIWSRWNWMEIICEIHLIRTSFFTHTITHLPSAFYIRLLRSEQIRRLTKRWTEHLFKGQHSIYLVSFFTLVDARNIIDSLIKKLRWEIPYQNFNPKRGCKSISSASSTLSVQTSRQLAPDTDRARNQGVQDMEFPFSFPLPRFTEKTFLSISTSSWEAV